MQVASNARRLARVLQQSPPILLIAERVQTPGIEINHSSLPWRSQYHNFTSLSSGTKFDDRILFTSGNQQIMFQQSTCSTMIPWASFASAAGEIEGGPTDAVKELYDKMLKSVKEKRSAPPNAWLWSLIEKSANREDIKLLFDILEKLRRFRLSNLRIHENFNCNLCREITKACIRVGAIDFGKKALWKHNVYGMSPSIGSAHHLLNYAKQRNDVSLMVEVMKLLKANDLQLQSGTADIVLSICYSTDNWDLISKYSKRFIMAGVKLRQTSFDVWMEFAAKIGDTDSLWKIEKLRSETMKKHSLATGFSCAKGYLLERKPENAAATIHVLNQTLSDTKRPGIMVELQKLVSDWPLEVIKRRKEEERKALATGLQADIPAMVSGLLNLGLEVNVKTENLITSGLLS